MQLTVVGCSGSLPGPDSPASCYVVSADGFHLVLDLGSGALGVLQRHVDVRDVGAVALSHLHPDHCMDLCGLYVAAKYAPYAPCPLIPVYGPPGTAERMAQAYGLSLDPGMTEQFEFRAWAAEQTIGPFVVRTSPAAHPVPAYAIRVEYGDRAVVYSGDTGPTDALVELARGADVLLCEAAFVDGAPDNAPGVHMTGTQAGEHAERAGVDRLIVTHVPPWYDRAAQAKAAAKAFGGEVLTAEPGAVYTV